MQRQVAGTAPSTPADVDADEGSGGGLAEVVREGLAGLGDLGLELKWRVAQAGGFSLAVDPRVDLDVGLKVGWKGGDRTLALLAGPAARS
jgi:hypothetical protein